MKNPVAGSLRALKILKGRSRHAGTGLPQFFGHLELLLADNSSKAVF
jgi:hypothetical protein